MRVPGILAAVAFACACSTFESSSDPAASPDGGADARPDGDGDGGAGVVNLLVNPDFEIGCAAWEAPGSSVTESTIAHGGSKSCQVCNTQTGAAFGIYGLASTPVPKGARFVGSVWVRKAPDAPSVGTFSFINVYGAAFEVSQNGPVTTGPMLTDEWQPISTVADVTTETGMNIKLAMSAVTSPTCFLVDDAVVYRAK